MSDWPPWAKLVAGLGFPIAAFIWLAVVITPMVRETHAMAVQQVANQDIVIAILRQICRNEAKNDLQAQFCEYGRPMWERTR